LGFLEGITQVLLVSFVLLVQDIPLFGLDSIPITSRLLVWGDGRLLYPKVSPYDWICITAVCKEMSSSLMQQLTLDRNLIAPVIEHGSRYLAVFEKEEQTFSRKVLCQVLYL